MKAQETTAVATPNEQLPSMNETASVMQMIAHAARDPNVDIDKMERLLAMHERMTDKKAESEFNDALNACQKEVGFVRAVETNSQTRSKYASFAQLDAALRPIYTKHGISISYGTEDTPKPDCVRVIAHVSRGGYTRIYRVDMPADGKGAKGGDVMTKTHATGAAMAYGSRYLLKGIFNVAVGEADIDGNTHGVKEMPEHTKVDFLAAIDALTTKADGETLWGRVVKACEQVGDISAYDELKKAMALKMKGLK